MIGNLTRENKELKDENQRLSNELYARDEEIESIRGSTFDVTAAPKAS